jgi:hypothetical protein
MKCYDLSERNITAPLLNKPMNEGSFVRYHDHKCTGYFHMNYINTRHWKKEDINESVQFLTFIVPNAVECIW